MHTILKFERFLYEITQYCERLQNMIGKIKIRKMRMHSKDNTWRFKYLAWEQKYKLRKWLRLLFMVRGSILRQWRAGDRPVWVVRPPTAHCRPSVGPPGGQWASSSIPSMRSGRPRRTRNSKILKLFCYFAMCFLLLISFIYHSILIFV